MTSRLSWFTQHRLNWIHEIVHIYGFINREHIRLKFRIGEASASRDLTRYQEHYPGVIAYNKSLKRYELLAGGLGTVDPPHSTRLS